ncbi:hypothetical protein GP486_002494 [Trichoglossum hirsutum]|uniref:Sterol regulatory element-binding protein cleavage-activating protein n=1 Tax=Trichoglossum hirsutum TaxID=265104 RepID=A0A9P8LEN6_9PEZI|nr:hypothetical protein GP486_002494 [Trichoglossum hirsutum]
MEPQALSPSHPLRRYLSRHVTTIVGRPTLVITVSVALGTAFCYLFALLDASGHLVGAPGPLGFDGWRTSVRRLAGGAEAVADVEIRQAWVYGDYMRALDRDVLVQALDVQEELLGHVLCCELPGPSRHSGASGGDEELESRALFHSPLMHWNCSLAALLSDSDVISTISQRPYALSSSSVTLTPPSIFSDVRGYLGGAELTYADAVVITLLYPHGSRRAEDIWIRGAKALAKSGKYDIYPSAGRIGNYLYEILCEPRSTSASFYTLFLAYGAVAAYVLSQLGKVSAVKSRSGLALAICVSVLAALATMVLLMNPSRTRRPVEPHIPREAYPVVLVVGLENMFRLTNAVLETPAEDSPTSRIARAMGDIGYVAVTAAAQNLALLYLFSKVFVSPEISNFCVFTAVVVTLDLALHMSFFLAVLSLDLRRLGLRVSISESAGYSSGASGRVRARGPSLLGLIFRVRTIGTVVLVGFVMALHWRYDLTNLLITKPHVVKPTLPMLVRTADFAPVFAKGPAQAEVQVGWLESQSVDTIKELARAVGLPSHHFIGNIHEPLVFVSKGADRSPAPHDRKISLSLFHAGRQLLIGRHRQFVLYIVLTSAVAGLLVSHLIRGEAVDETGGASNAKKPQITVQRLDHGHTYDIVMLAASAKGALASVGLDRRILIWRLRGGQPAVESIVSAQVSPSNTNRRILWPVTAIALDDHAEWLAVCSQGGSISLWNIHSKEFIASGSVKCGASEGPVSFFFAPRSFGTGDTDNTRLILVRKSGLMTEVEIRENPDTMAAVVDHQITLIGTTTIFSSHPLHSSRTSLRLVSTTRDGGIHVTTKRGRGIWTSERLSLPKTQLSAEFQDMEFVPVRALGIMGFVTSKTSPDVYMLDVPLCGCFPVLYDWSSGFLTRAFLDDILILLYIYTAAVICRFRLNNPKPGTLRTIHSSRQPCRSCGASAIASFSIAYVELESGELVMHTFVPNATQTERGYLICLRAERDPREKRCAGFEKASQRVSRLEIRAGSWESTLFNSICGIRKRPLPPTCGRKPEAPSGGTAYQRGLGSYGMVRRRNGGWGDQQPETPSTISEEDEWEVWTISSTGEVVIRSLSDTSLTPDGVPGPRKSLMVTKTESACPVGKKSVAIGFGATIKVVQLGTELYDDVDYEDGSQPVTRRKPLAAKKTNSARSVR